MTNRNHQRRGVRGFSLAECVFSIFVVAASAFILAGIVPLASSSSARARNREIALNQANGVLNQIFLTNSTQITPANLLSAGYVTSSGAFGDALPGSPTTLSGDNLATILPQGTETISVYQQPNGGVEVNVVVSWVDMKSTHSISIWGQKYIN